MANEVLLAALAIGAIFLVVKSGDSDKKKLNEKRSSDEAGGMSREEAAKANPSEQETGDRQTWLGRLQEVENEYAFLVDWESRNGAVLHRGSTKLRVSSGHLVRKNGHFCIKR